MSDNNFEKTPVKANIHKLIINSLRDTGYRLEDGINEMVDNSIDAGATNVEVELLEDTILHTKNNKSELNSVIVKDDGKGMNREVLQEALSLGSDRLYEKNSLGKYGLGMITGAISCARRLSLFSSPKQSNRVNFASLDLDRIEEENEAFTMQKSFTKNELKAQEKTLIKQLGEETYKYLTDLCSAKKSGTVLVVSNFDRVTKKFNKIRENVELSLGRIYREKINENCLNIFCNGNPVLAYDFCCFDDEYTIKMSGIENNGFKAETYINPDTGERYHFWWRGTYQQARTSGSGGGSERRRSAPQGFCIIRNGREILAGKTFGLYKKTTNTTGFIVELKVDSKISQDLIGIKFSKNDTTVPNGLIHKGFQEFLKEKIVIPCRNIVYTANNKVPSGDLNKVFENGNCFTTHMENMTKMLKGLPDREKTSGEKRENSPQLSKKSPTGKKNRKPSMKRNDIRFNFQLRDWPRTARLFEVDTELDGKSLTLLVNQNHSFYKECMNGEKTDNPLFAFMWAMAISETSLLAEDEETYAFAMEQFFDTASHNLTQLARIK